ncbi:unnamed protein product [Rhizoctonia solani]|uniref:Uncharacterized protein n=1 Tax=Rhizoctonia solani TaxID=456999 RepID=A0A8H3G9Y2_9AGAM|nr:unnamed protein product [Rhizoctonia solani]
MACSKPSAFWGTVVDIFPKSGTENEGGGLPMVGDIRSYFEDLDSVLPVVMTRNLGNRSFRLVYHVKRVKKLARSDHIYLVFKLPEGADAFAKEWWLQGEDYLWRAHYMVQRNPEFCAVLLRELKSELEFISRVAGSEGAIEPARFRGPAFAKTSPPESGSLLLSAFIEKERDYFRATSMGQVFRRMKLEEMLVMISTERDEIAEEIVELMKEVGCHKRRLSRYRNQ